MRAIQAAEAIAGEPGWMAPFSPAWRATISRRQPCAATVVIYGISSSGIKVSRMAASPSRASPSTNSLPTASIWSRPAVALRRSIAGWMPCADYAGGHRAPAVSQPMPRAMSGLCVLCVISSLPVSPISRCMLCCVPPAPPRTASPRGITRWPAYVAGGPAGRRSGRVASCRSHHERSLRQRAHP